MPAGRPTTYTQEKANEICQYVSQGMSMRSVAKIEGMPSLVVFFNWLRLFPEFKKQFELAEKERAHAFVEDIIEISDEPPPSYIDDKGNTRYDPGGVTWHRNRCENRKWIAAKILPKQYGERLGLDNADDSKPFSIVIKKLNE